MPSKNFSNKEIDLAELFAELREFFEMKNYNIEFKEGAASTTILDASKSGPPRDWLGLSLKATFRVKTESGVIRVWLGNQQWFDKIIVGSIGLLLWLSRLWLFQVLVFVGGYGFQFLAYIIPLLLILLPAIGTYLQFQVIQDAWSVVENHVALRRASIS